MNAPRKPLPSARASTQRTHRGCGGFTLVEVLITTAVTLVAFTGLASLQILSLRAAESALQRSQATELAYGMIDRLRLNRGAPGSPTTALGGAYDDESICANSDRGCTRDNDFTPTDTATTGLREWRQEANALGLNDWFAGIEREGDLFRVAVQWDDARAEGDSSSADADHASCLGGNLGPSTQEICLVTQL